MMRIKNKSRDLIIIFGRYPSPGKTKTRLIPTLGRIGAADLQRVLTEHTVQMAKGTAKGKKIGLEFCFDGDGFTRVKDWLGRGLFYFRQHPGDLGSRMLQAFVESFKRGYRRVILLGTDIPGVKPDHLLTAFDELNRRDYVLGPSRDGGYWLIGMKEPLDLFQGIEWGTGRVLAQTMARGERLGLAIAQLPPLSDIDTQKDLRLWVSNRPINGPFVSVIIPALNEESYISKTIESARDPESEIILVDGGSRDGTREIAQGAGAHVIRGTPGRARQQNLGASMARGEVLLFLHADTLLPPHYIDTVFNVLISNRTLLGAFRFKTDYAHPGMKLIHWGTDLRSKVFKMPYGDQALFLRKRTFEAHGGFPDRAIAEDLFLVKRIKKQGNIRIAPVPVVTSGRRWRRLGIVRTTLINILIAAGCLIGVSPQRLSPLYRLPERKSYRTPNRS